MNIVALQPIPSKHIRHLFVYKNTLIFILDSSFVYDSRNINLPTSIINASLQASTLIILLSTGHLVFIDLESLTISYVLKQSQLSIENYGWSITADSHYKTLALTSFRNRILFQRFGNYNSTDSFHEITLDTSLILHTAFLYPLKGVDNQHLYFIAVCALPEAKIRFRIYEWYTQNSLSDMALVSVQPVSLGSSPLPIFIVPIPCSDGAMLVFTESSVFLLLLPDMLSGKVDYKQYRLPSFPVAYYQEPYTDSTYHEIQHVYLATELNVIYTITVNTATETVTIAPLVDLQTTLGSSLIIIPSNEAGDPTPEVSIIDAANLTIHTAGDGAVGGTFFVTSTESAVNVEYLTSFQSFGPLRDAVTLESDALFDCLRSETQLFVTSGVDSASSALVHLRRGYSASVALEGLPMQGVKTIFSAKSSQGSYLLASYPYFAQLFQIVDPEEGSDDALQIVDYSVLAELDLGAETLLFAPLGPDHFVHVTPSQAVITNFSGGYRAAEDKSIVAASVSGQHIVIAERMGEVLLAVKLYKFADNILEPVGSIEFPHDIACLKLANLGDGRLLIIIGSFTSEISIYEFNIDTAKLEISSQFENYRSDLNNLFLNDAVIIQGNLVIGTNSGSVVFVRPDGIFVKQVGSLPIQFFQTAERTFALSDSLFAIDNLSDLDFPQRVIIESKISWRVQAACLFPISSGTETVVAAVIDHSLNILVVDQTPDTISRRIPLRAVPRRAMHVPHLGMIAIMFETSCKTSRPSFLRFYDCKKNVIVTPNEDYDNWKPKITNDPGFVDETMLAIIMWEFSVNGKQFKYIVLGSGIETKFGAKRGFVYVLSASRTKSGRVELQKRFVIATSAPVTGLAQLDEYTIVCGQRDKLELYKLSIDGDKCRVKEIDNNGLQCPSPVASIQVVKTTESQTFLSVGTLKSSIVLYHYDSARTPELISVCGDEYLRSIVCQCTLDDGTIVTSDKQRTVNFFQAPSISFQADKPVASSSTLKVLATVTLPTIIAKLIPVKEEISEIQKLIDPTHPAATDLVNTVLAVGLNGAVYKLLVLDDSSVKVFNWAAHAIANALPADPYEALMCELEQLRNDNSFDRFGGYNDNLPGRVLDWKKISQLHPKNRFARLVATL